MEGLEEKGRENGTVLVKKRVLRVKVKVGEQQESESEVAIFTF